MSSYLPHDHDLTLVILSYVVAFFASYTALDMGERLRNAGANASKLWLTGSAVVLGGGIWSMHFIAMLAFHVDLPVSYDITTTVASLLIAVLFTGIGFYIVAGATLTPLRLIWAGIIVGFGVAAMHYTGMAAVRMNAEVHYDSLLFAVSVVIAMGAAIVALWLAFSVRTAWQTLAAALVMAVAICGMHYTGMAAMMIHPTDGPALASGLLSKPLLAVAVAGATLVLMLMALVSVFVDRRFEAQAEREAIALRIANAQLQGEIEIRQAAERKLMEAHTALEERVLERTKELASANERLVASSMELEAARERAEREKERAEKANSAKSDFLSSMSHELRTPLNSILGFTQLLEFNIKDALSPRQARQVAQIHKSGEHLLSLIDDVLDLSKIESGNIKLSLEAVPVMSVLDQVRASLSPIADEAGLEIAIEMPGEAPIAYADRTRLLQVLMNLGANALKYNRSGGRLTFVAKVVDKTVRLLVADTGKGIPLERQNELFQPFNRLGAEHSAVEGTGIGLTITQRLVHLMNGQISFNSVPGLGTTFSIVLPASEANPLGIEERMKSNIVGLNQRRRGYTMLYIEDNPSNIELMRSLTEALDNVGLLTASHPKAGLALATANRPDVIVLDIDLPDMNGFEVLQHLKAAPATVRIPVIALSAAAMPRDVERGMAAGFTHYLTKPINVREFIAAVDSVLTEPARDRQHT